MAEASKVSGEKYRRTFPEYDPVFAVRLELFFEISFPWGIGNNCSCIYLSGNSTDFTILYARFDMFFRHRNFVRQHFSLKRAGIIFMPVFRISRWNKHVDVVCPTIGLARACADKWSWTLLPPALRDWRGGPELDYASPRKLKNDHCINSRGKNPSKNLYFRLDPCDAF